VNHEQPRFVLQEHPDRPVQPCGCGSPFGIVKFSAAGSSLRCQDCDSALHVPVHLHDLTDKRRSPSHDACSRRRIVVPRVREDVSAENALRGAERLDLFCVDCGRKDGMLPKDALRAHPLGRRRDKNDVQRPDVVARAGGRCEMCFAGPGVALEVGHCLSKHDARVLEAAKVRVGDEIIESMMNKCALCLPCNQAYSGRSMHRSIFVALAHTRAEFRKMLDVGEDTADPIFRRIFALLKKARELSPIGGA